MNNGKHRSAVLNSSGEKHTDEEQAGMAAAAPALAAVPREPVAKEQQVEEPVAEQVVNIVSVRQQCQALRSHRHKLLLQKESGGSPQWEEVSSRSSGSHR